MRIADLFAGCGGMSEGFGAAGFEVAFAAETWRAARLAYDLNHDVGATPLDLSDVVAAASAVDRFRPDVVVGGPPCQDFSLAGMMVEGDRARLTTCFAATVRAVRPTWFVMENVTAAVGTRQWRGARSTLRRAGYGISEVVLDASLYGVPQARRRAFMVGRLDERDGFLDARVAASASDVPTTVRRAMPDLAVEHYYSHPRHPGRRAVFCVDEPAPTVRGTNRPVPPGYRAHPDDSAPASSVRALDWRERARVQSFRADYDFGRQSASVLDLVVANAVPPLLARALASAVLAHEGGLAVPCGVAA